MIIERHNLELFDIIQIQTQNVSQNVPQNVTQNFLKVILLPQNVKQIVRAQK